MSTAAMATDTNKCTKTILSTRFWKAVLGVRNQVESNQVLHNMLRTEIVDGKSLRTAGEVARKAPSHEMRKEQLRTFSH